jgi:Endomembrane protein 70
LYNVVLTDPFVSSVILSVKLKVNKMTSSQTLMPLDYYRLPFCAPEGGPKMDRENLGEFLAGDRIESSPYRLQMKTEMYCEQLCITNLGRGEQRGVTPNKVVKTIRRNYHNNWIVDNLPAASKAEDDATVTTRYWQGFPVGYVDPDTKMAFINNHVNIEIMYHAVETEVDKYRIVRFTVEPFSIKHAFEPSEDDVAGDDFVVAKITNPIASCDPKNKKKPVHTDFDMITTAGREPQEASGKVLFTYDVTWVENKELQWASRWDVYLSMDNAIPARVHWFSILNSLIIVAVLSGMIVAILVRNLRRDFARYNRLATDEEKAEDLEEFGWKLVHADVFRPPSFSPVRHRRAAALHGLPCNRLLGHGIFESCQPWCSSHGGAASLRPDGMGGWVRDSPSLQDFQGQELAAGHYVGSSGISWYRICILLLNGSSGFGREEHRCCAVHHHDRPPSVMVWNLDSIGLFRCLLWIQAGRD